MSGAAMSGKGIASSVAQGRGQRDSRPAARVTQGATAKPAVRRTEPQVTLLRLTALRLIYQAIRMVEDAELCEAGL